MKKNFLDEKELNKLKKNALEFFHLKKELFLQFPSKATEETDIFQWIDFLNENNSEAIEQLTEIIQGSFGYNKILQCNMTNKLTKSILKKGKDLIIDSSGEVSIQKNGFTIFVKEYEKAIKQLKPSSYQTLDIFTEVYTQGDRNDTLIIISVEDYMKKRGLTDRHYALKRAKADVEALDLIRMTFSEKDKKGNANDYLKIGITGNTYGVSRGYMYFRFNQDFIKVLNNCGYIMAIPDKLYKINTRDYPHAYFLGRKILEQKRINLGKLSENKISVATLLDNCPSLPKRSEIGREAKRRIINPFFNDLSCPELAELFSWKLQLEDKSIITKKEITKLKWVAFEKAMLIVVWLKPPDLAKIVETRNIKRVKNASIIQKIKLSQKNDNKENNEIRGDICDICKGTGFIFSSNGKYAYKCICCANDTDGIYIIDH